MASNKKKEKVFNTNEIIVKMGFNLYSKDFVNKKYKDKSHTLKEWEKIFVKERLI